MIYLIGGAPRIGKTQAVEKMLARKPMHAVSSDAIRYMLRRTFPSEQLHEALLESEKSVLERDAAAILKDQNEESEALWPFLVQLMRCYNQDGYDLLIEGVAILPEYVTDLSFPVRSVFLTNADLEHAETIRQLAAANEHDWLHKYDDAQVRAYTDFFQHMSEYIAQQATSHNLPLVQVHDKTFSEDTAKAVDILLN